MKAAQLRRVISQYRKLFESEGVKKVEFSLEDHISSSCIPMYQHCHFMLDKIERFIEQNQIHKANRWLGFVQGVLWARSLKTINELRKDNKN